MNILIVDDEIDTLEEIEFYVKKYGRFDSCIVCKNAVEALEQGESLNFDIALLDIEMPVINGIELAKKLIKLFPDIKIAFITAYNHYAAEAFEVNAIDYVLKPIREERLFKTFDRVFIKRADSIKSKTDNYRLRIQTFGKFVVKIENNVVKWNRQKSAEIFAYLLENKGIPVHKEKLCDMLWPNLEPRKALANLQTTIYSIRKTFKEYNIKEISIEYSINNYTLNVKDAFIDMVEFENVLWKAEKLQEATFLDRAEKLYIGEYLEDDGWIWAESKKEELRKRYMTTCYKLKKTIK